MPKFFTIFFYIVFLVIIAGCSEQKQPENILEKKVSLDTADIRKLIEQGHMTDNDRVILVSHLMKHPGFALKTITYRELLDVVKEIKKHNTQEIAQRYNYGSDSVFLKNPMGEKFFLGLGEMTFEELVERESRQLPDTFIGEYNVTLAATQKTIPELIPGINAIDAMLLGNIIFIKTEENSINQCKIGDVIEISKRIKSSKEFAPFLKNFNENQKGF